MINYEKAWRFLRNWLEHEDHGLPQSRVEVILRQLAIIEVLATEDDKVS